MSSKLDYYYRNGATFNNSYDAEKRLEHWERWMGGISNVTEPLPHNINADQATVDRLTREAVTKLISELMRHDTATLRKCPAHICTLLQKYKVSPRIVTLIFRAACEEGEGDDTDASFVPSMPRRFSTSTIRAIFNDVILTEKIEPPAGNGFAQKLVSLRKLGLVNRTKSFRHKPASVSRVIR